VQEDDGHAAFGSCLGDMQPDSIRLNITFFKFHQNDCLRSNEAGLYQRINLGLDNSEQLF
jgi:hypothetical protein